MRPHASQGSFLIAVLDLLDGRAAEDDVGGCMLGMIRVETVLVALVILNLIGLSVAAYVIMRKK